MRFSSGSVCSMRSRGKSFGSGLRPPAVFRCGLLSVRRVRFGFGPGGQIEQQLLAGHIGAFFGGRSEMLFDVVLVFVVLRAPPLSLRPLVLLLSALIIFQRQVL